ncbi:tetratricopeptide repeat protein [Minwuia sp.]|uniref:tetratricopeptide repeat protein n=1 Tax=Minwuia sp. TaxID=2493630 RepID=UPI003A93DB91
MIFVRLLILLISLSAWAGSATAETFKQFYDQGRAAREAGDLDRAEALFRAAMDKAPGNPDAALFLGLTLNGLGRPEEAVRLLEPFVERFPDYVGLDLALIRAMAAVGDHDRAERRMDALLQRFPDNAAARALDARIDLYQQRPAEAERKYAALLSDEPDNRAAQVGSIDAALALPDIARAERRLQRLEATFPGDPAITSRRERLRGLKQARDAREDWIVALGYRVGDFDPDLKRHEGVLDIVRERPGDIYRLRLETESRNGEVDAIADAFLTPWRNEIYVPTLRLGIGPGNDFLPDYRVGADVSVRVRDAGGLLPVTVLDAGILASGLNDGQAERLSLGAVQYFDVGYGSFYTTFRGFLTNDENGNNILGWVGQADWRFPGGWAIRGGYGVAPEDSEGRTIVIRTAFSAVELPLSDRTTVIGSFAREDIRDITRRYFIGLTLKYEF